jgi:hypothetical protein
MNTTWCSFRLEFPDLSVCGAWGEGRAVRLPARGVVPAAARARACACACACAWRISSEPRVSPLGVRDAVHECVLVRCGASAEARSGSHE